MPRPLVRLAAALVAFALWTPGARAQTAPPPTPPEPEHPDQPFPPLIDKPQLRVPLVWEGRRFSTLDWAVTGGATGVALVSSILPPVSSHWTGTNGFDEAFRDTFRLGSQHARYTIRDVSDVFLSVEVTWPFFVDALIGAWWYHDSPDVAAQMALVDAEAVAIGAALQQTATLLSSRQRPNVRDCGSSFLPATTNDCTSDNIRYRGFFSGHASISFLGASLTCVHHLKLELFGNRTADVGICAAAYAGAAATAFMRVMGDVHYMSDILLGAAVGTAVGLTIPLIHYRKAGRGEVSLLPFGAGLGLGGRF